jgi:hypothetical protein
LDETLKILLKHYGVGSLVAALVFWFVEEIPDPNDIERHGVAWVSTIISIPLAGLLVSKFIGRSMAQPGGFRVYLVSFLSLFSTWVLLLYAKALGVGLVATLRTGQEQLLDSLIGYTVFQLWVYAGIGLIYGILGGAFLGIELQGMYKQKTLV